MEDLRRRIEEFFSDYECVEEFDGYSTIDYLADAVSLLNEAYCCLSEN